MSEFIAALPMYDWPEVRAETDALWARIRDHLRGEGIAAPDRLVRRNADMPQVPGGIRDEAGRQIAPDPATLPPQELDLHTLWRHPRLLFAQTCWGPMELGLAGHVRVVVQPDYSDFDGGKGEFYSSAILMRREEPSSRPAMDASADRGGGGGTGGTQPSPRPAPHAAPADPSRGGEGDMAPPADGSAAIPLDRMRGLRLAYNNHDSMSGIIGLTRDLERQGESLDIFAARIETGSHRASARALAEGRADVCAIDCRTWQLTRRFEPAAAQLRVVGWTARRKGLPYIAARAAPAYELPARLL